MDLAVRKSGLSGMIDVPGSKSHTIRGILLGLLADGTTTLKKPLVSEDTISCLSAASILGAWIKRGDDTIWRIAGTSGNLLEPAGVIDMGDSGTGLSLFSAVASLMPFAVSFDGDASLRTRKMGPLLTALETLGVEYSSAEGGLCPLTVKGPVQSGETLVDGPSSQYVSALLLIAPLLKGDTIIHVKNPCEVPYVLMTLAWMKRQGIAYEVSNDLTWFKVQGNQKYHAFTTTIPVDFSTAAFPLLAAAVTGSSIVIPNLDFEDTQGDKAVFDIFASCGVKIKTEDGMTTITGPKELKPFEADLNATPDAVPVLSVLAAFAKGESRLLNVAQARAKETDRLACMAKEIGKMGVKVEELPDGLIIQGGNPKASGEFMSYADHRIAMALSAGALALDGESIIQGAEASCVTYPDFIEDFRKLGASFTIL